MNFYRNIKNPSLLVFADQAIYSGSNFVLTFLLARVLSVSDFGMYSYVILATYFLLSISNAIIIQPYQIVISKKPVLEAMGFITKLKAAWLFFIILFFYFIYFILNSLQLPPFNLQDFKLTYLEIFTGSLVFVLGYLTQDFFRKTLLASQKLSLVLLIDLLFLIVFPIILIFPFSLNQILLLIGLVNLFSAIPGLIYFIRHANFNTPNAYYLNYHIKSGKWLLSTAILQWMSNNFLVFVSGLYLGLEVLGALRLVQSFFGVLNVVLQTVENFFLPKIAQLHQKNQIQAQQYLSNITKKGFIAFGFLLLGFFIFSDPIILLLGGEKYGNFGYVVKLMSVLYLFIFYGYPTRIEIRILELNKYFFLGYILSVFFTLCSFHFLLKYASLYGAVFGLIISQVLMIAYWKFKLNKNHATKWI